MEVQFLSVDSMSLPNAAKLIKLIEYANMYKYYCEFDSGCDYYLFAFSNEPLTRENALDKWRDLNQ